MIPVKPRVFVAQPVYGDVPYEAAAAFTQMIASGSSRQTVIGVGQSNFGILSQARNNLIREALARTDATHLLLIDCDMVPRHNTLTKLLEQDKDIISSLYFMRHAPHLPVATTTLPVGRTSGGRMELEASSYLLDYPENSTVAVGGVGMGCCLIRRKVFEEMQAKYGDEKWFSFENNEGEDFWFCRRAAELGYSVYVDTGNQCGHVSSVIITCDDFKRMRHAV